MIFNLLISLAFASEPSGLDLAETLRNWQIESLEAKYVIYGDKERGRLPALELLRGCELNGLKVQDEKNFIFSQDYLAYMGRIKELESQKSEIARRINELKDKNKELFRLKEEISKALESCALKKERERIQSIAQRENKYGYLETGGEFQIFGFEKEYEAFMNEAKGRGHVLYVNDLKVIGDERFTCAGKSKYLYGCCKKSKGRAKILISLKKWQNLSETNRLRVLSHELGHCLLGLTHEEVVSSELSIMHAPFRVKEEEAFQKDKKRYFDELFHPLKKYWLTNN